MAQMWNEQTNTNQWRQWKTTAQELNIPTKVDLSLWKQETTNHLIIIKQGPDILQWGHSSSDTFMIKEAYCLKVGFPHEEAEDIWARIWNSNICPKINTFRSMVVQNRILTWDNS